MKFKLFYRAFTLMGLLSQPCYAFLVATEPAQLRAGVPTDVFVAGDGEKQDDLFLKAALLSARVSRDRFPHRQQVLISTVNESLAAEKSLLTEAGFHLRRADTEKLDKQILLSLFANLKSPISSLQFFAHSNTKVGMQLQGSSRRLSEKDPEFAQIKNYLAPYAIAVFHSCNSGWVLAPAAARLWNRPAFGSLASGDFQEMMSDGKWYFHDEGLFPENLSRIGFTSGIVRQNISCKKLECLRLKPANTAYRGVMGRFDRGLGFYKVFATNAEKIPAALMHYTLLVPSVTPLSLQSSRKEILTVVKDWMCPSDKNGRLRQACSDVIDSGAFQTNSTLNFFSGQPVACNSTECFTTVKCSGLKSSFGVPPCKTVDLSEARSTVFSDQMKMIMKGLQLLEQGKLQL